MTATDVMPIGITHCPDWCIEEKDFHGSLHESVCNGVDLPDRPDTLFVGLAQDPTELARPEVTLHDGDALLTTVSPSSGRSLAAHIIAAADRAEGLR